MIKNDSGIWKTIVIFQAGVIATLVFNWLALAKDVVTKDDLAREFAAHGIVARNATDLAAWRATTDARIAALERMQEHYDDQVQVIIGAIDNVNRRLK